MNPIQIIQGGEITFTVRITNSATGDPYDLTSCTALTTCFTKSDGTELVLGIGTGIVITNAVLGKFTITVTSTQSALLAPIELATLEFSVTMGVANPFKKQIPQAYSVIQSVC